MVDFKDFIDDGNFPIYLQIISYIKQKIIAGEIENDDVMPSRRILSATIGVNPNTIQKSYKILEEEGIILSQTGAKSVITINEKKVSSIREEMIGNILIESLKKLKDMGFDKKDLLSLLEKYWED